MKKYILGLLTGVIFTSITGVIAYQLTASQVTYQPKDENWNVNTVKAAVDDLKAGCSQSSFKMARIISGDVNTVGSVVEIYNEEFYVIGQGTGSESGKVKLLAKNSLKDTDQVSSSDAPDYQFASSKYWNGKVGEGLDYSGSYSGNPYPYVYDSNSSLYSMVNAYLNKLKRLGVTGATGRLMTYEEAVALPVGIRKNDTEYWLGSANSNQYVWSVKTNGDLDEINNTDKLRPVILVPTKQIG